MDYDLELDAVVERIKNEKAKSVCIQLPEGLRPQAAKIADVLLARTGATVIIWAGSCYGACDTPDLSAVGTDLLVQWGHSPWI